ncbi:MAG: hypothetical protein DBX55_05050 [Verrucomicrobia bacterium]|nr:MAG: hypothetical protein DBX55_05050 [Verrucomicrobiota bacterium]
MNPLVFKIAAAASFAALPILHAAAQDALLDEIESARSAAWAGLECYDNALVNANSAVDVISAMSLLSQSMQERCDNLDAQFARQSADLKNIEYSLRVLKEKFARDKGFMESAKSGLDAAARALPLGERRMALADKISERAGALVSKNPGANYQDRNYFASLSTSYSNAKAAFKRAQNSISRLSVDVNIADPRMAGIANMSAMAGDFLDKAQSASSKNGEELEALRGGAKKLSEQSVAGYAKLNALTKRLRESKIAFVGEYMKLIRFMENEMPASPKYAEHIFKPNPNIRLRLLRDAAEAALGERANVSGPIASSLSRSVKAKNADGNFYRPAAAAERRDSAIPQAASNKTARDEILKLGEELSALTAELTEAADLLESVAREAQNAIYSIQFIETSAQAILKDSIAAATSAQVLSSDIAILKSELEVASAQANASNAQFEKLSEAVGKFISFCDEESKKIGERLRKAKALLAE